MPDVNPAPVWHQLAAAAVLSTLDSNGQEGLTEQQVAERLAKVGENSFPAARRINPLLRFLRQFNNMLIYVLLAASAVSLALQHWIDAGVIVGMVLIMAVIGSIQEGRAEKALHAIRHLLSHTATVKRNGQKRRLGAETLAPGDIIYLQSGDRVPADLRLLEVRDLHVDESVLTGESVPVTKASEPLPEMTVFADRHNMAYTGTFITYGRGTGVVVATGPRTELGRVVLMAETEEAGQTPLLKQINILSRVLTVIIVALAAGTFAVGTLIQHSDAGSMFVAAVALAVAAIPEGLPAIITITLAIGVQHMARRNVVIRHLPSVETLGAVTVICSDKTGTLTHNEMMVRSVILSDSRLEVTGEGYNPHGSFRLDEQDIEAENLPALMGLALAACLCNEASLEDGGQWILHGSPTEGALLAMAMKAGMQPQQQGQHYRRIDTLPFESENQLMATLHHDHAGNAWIMVKGAPERLLALCNQQRRGKQDEPLDRQYWEKSISTLGELGHRTLALATRAISVEQIDLHPNDIDNLTLLGIVGISDPPREDAIEAVARCRQAGIRIKMVTGDLPATAGAIGKHFKLDCRAILTGADLDAMDDVELRAQAARVDVYARTSPEHKLRLVKALQTNGEVVAMTGDGVNDAPALKRADIGIAMGRRGTEVAREAADMVLTQDNFTNISQAVEEGRAVYDNIKKSVLFMLPTGLAEAFVVVLATLLDLTLPITPVQILWVNTITAVTLGIALSFEPPEQDVMLRPPRDPDESLFSGLLGWRIFFVSLIILGGAFSQFLWALQRDMSIEEARTITINCIALFEAFYLLSSRYLLLPVLNWRGLTGNPYVLLMIALTVLLQLLFTYAPAMQYLFNTRSLAASEWPAIIATAASILLLVEVEKTLMRRRQMK